MNEDTNPTPPPARPPLSADQQPPPAPVSQPTTPEQGGDQLETAIAELRGVVDTMKPGTAAGAHDAPTGDKRLRGESFWNISVDIQAVLGSTALTVRQLLELESEQVLPLDRGMEEPLDLMVNGRVIAKAELEKDAANRLGLRVVEVLDVSLDRAAG